MSRRHPRAHTLEGDLDKANPCEDDVVSFQVYMREDTVTNRSEGLNCEKEGAQRASGTRPRDDGFAPSASFLCEVHAATPFWWRCPWRIVIRGSEK